MSIIGWNTRQKLHISVILLVEVYSDYTNCARMSSCVGARGIHPLRSKYSLCCSVSGVTPVVPRWVPQSCSSWGYPSPVLANGVPQDRGITSLLALGRGYPQKRPGVSHWATPWKEHGTCGSIMGWRRDTPSPGCGLTNECLEYVHNQNIDTYRQEGWVSSWFQLLFHYP